MDNYQYNTEEELLQRAETMMGFTIRDLDESNTYTNTSSKGRGGHVIEYFGFGYDINNDQEPDIANLGVEIKTTGYVWLKDQKRVSAKERLVLSMIDFENDYNKNFYESHAFAKMNKILLILYEYVNGQKMEDMVYTNYYLHEHSNLSEKDKLIIENDWKVIQGKIMDGKAHELSESDTLYLGACPKGRNKEDTIPQKFSKIEAMRRAYSLKTKFMTSLLRNNIFHEVENRESFIKDINLLRNKSMEEIIYDLFSSYTGKTLEELDSEIGKVLPKTGKSFLVPYISHIMKVNTESLDHLEEFEKAGIVIKTVRLEVDGKLKESMSFPAVDFNVVATETWESSEIYEFFSTSKLLLVVFQKTKEGSFVFVKTKLWNMPSGDLDVHVREVWERFNAVLNGTLELKLKKNRHYNNLPKQSENKVSHIRPHASDRTIVSSLPDTCNIELLSTDNSFDTNELYIKNNVFTKQCFWLNNTYVLDIIKD